MVRRRGKQAKWPVKKKFVKTVDIILTRKYAHIVKAKCSWTNISHSY